VCECVSVCVCVCARQEKAHGNTLGALQARSVMYIPARSIVRVLGCIDTKKDLNAVVLCSNVDLV
jgi:hypothetical protein